MSTAAEQNYEYGYLQLKAEGKERQMCLQWIGTSELSITVNNVTKERLKDNTSR